MRVTISFFVFFLLLAAFSGCSVPQMQTEDVIYHDEFLVEFVELEEEAVALSASPAAIDTMLTVEASGTLTKKNQEAIIDYSNTEDGYIMVKYTASTTKRLKAQVKGPTTTYTYNLTPGKWEVFPLSDGDGNYKITVYRNAHSSKYAAVLSVSCKVSLTDEFAPFLRPNQYVDYAAAPNTIEKAAELTEGLSDPLDIVEEVYTYVVDHLSYDTKKASTVKSGYLPDLDVTLEEQKGICFDYAALMTGMLRSQGVPCKLVIGYAGKAYHAWISVWTEESGWIEGVVFFDGTSWKRLDPTFASSGKKSSSIMEFINSDKNYSTKYLY